MMKRTLTVLAGLSLALAIALPMGAEEMEAPSQILITNVDVWDGTSDTVAKGTDVLIEGDKIKEIGKGIKAPGANVIDGQGGPPTGAYPWIRPRWTSSTTSPPTLPPTTRSPRA